ncbi:MAG TPA: hypothetical protein EYO73_11615 [Sulfurimonas sp.]|nr:hypothetical protein [Sulfurimonas sp.]
MIKRILIILLFLTLSTYGFDDLQYNSDQKSSLEKLLSYKQIQLQDNLFLNLDLFSLFLLVDDSSEAEEPDYLLNGKNPDKTFLTLSYKF